jgi:hypothetical protein
MSAAKTVYSYDMGFLVSSGGLRIFVIATLARLVAQLIVYLVSFKPPSFRTTIYSSYTTSLLLSHPDSPEVED